MKKIILSALISILWSYNCLAESDSSNLNKTTSLQAADNLSHAFENVAETVSPSVVNVSTTSESAVNMEELENPFKEFFGERFFERFKEQGNTPKHGLGTGVIIDADGHILTNDHVVGDSDKVEIRFLNNSKPYNAKVVGKDPATDLAVLKVEGAPKDLLVPAKLGSSDDLKIGEWVVAVGNPFGLDHSITAGIVSAKGRSLMMPDKYEDFIQTDAAINPGNSGGPLVNLRGEVVGINSAIFSRSGGYMGIGFAIPSSIAKSVSTSLIEEGRVVRGWLGVSIQNLTEDLATSFGSDSSKGVLVGQVQANGPAEEGGVKQGDIIIGVSGKKVEDVNELRNMIAAIKPGSSVGLLILRGGETRTIEIKIGELPSKAREAFVKNTSRPSNQNKELSKKLGIVVQDITDEIAESLQLSSKDGVAIVEVNTSSPAFIGGLRRLDIIKKINDIKVTSSSQLVELLTTESLQKGVRMIVEQQGMERFVFIKIR